MQVKKVVDAVKQEKNATRGNVGKENLDENVDDPPPALPVKPARAAKKLPQVQVQASLKGVLNRIFDLVFLRFSQELRWLRPKKRTQDQE